MVWKNGVKLGLIHVHAEGLSGPLCWAVAPGSTGYRYVIVHATLTWYMYDFKLRDCVWFVQ